MIRRGEVPPPPESYEEEGHQRYKTAMMMIALMLSGNEDSDDDGANARVVISQSASPNDHYDHHAIQTKPNTPRPITSIINIVQK